MSSTRPHPRITVRPAAAADVPALAALTAACYRTAFAHILEAEALALREEPFFVDLFTTKLGQIDVAVACMCVAAEVEEEANTTTATPHCCTTGAVAGYAKVNDASLELNQQRVLSIPLSVFSHFA